VSEERFCSNCRAALPDDADSCPACGVYAGDLYDERVHRAKTRYKLFGALIALALIAAGAAVWWNARGGLPGRKPPATAAPSVRVVHDRPGTTQRAAGAKINEAEALRLVRRHLVTTTGISADCIAILGAGSHHGAYIVIAQDRCTSTRLGRWRVDGKNGAVTRAGTV